MPKQKFHQFDIVHIAKDLGPSMTHFAHDCDAIVVGSYEDKFDTGSTEEDTEYTLYIDGIGENSWYPESGLTLVESGEKYRRQVIDPLPGIWKELHQKVAGKGPAKVKLSKSVAKHPK